MQITIELPDHLIAHIQIQVTSGHHATPSDYIEALIQADQAQAVHLETLLLEGLNSGPATPMTAGDWAYIRTSVRQNLSKENAQHSSDDTPIGEIRESIYRGWQDALAGRTKPVS
jgi:antitoxin ParD1/3/4